MTTVARPDEQAELETPVRGPMRPRRLVSVRARQGRRLSSHGFRSADLLALGVVTVVVCAVGSPMSLLRTPVADVVPFVVGAWVLARVLRAFGLYGFVRSDGPVRHLGRLVAGGVVAAAAALSTSALLASAPGRHSTALLQWVALSVTTLAGLHMLWWLMVRRWRRAGWLTPNVVVVGATGHAERIVSDALERGHVNVIGIFDDRRERSPRAVLGVPVLGDLDALITHRMVPYLDRIVIAIDPSATRRVREVMARLAVLPNEVTMVIADDDPARRPAALKHLEDLPLADLAGGADVDRRAFAKRVQDLVLAVLALLVLSPLLAAIAVLVKTTSPGPVFFRQRRHGFNHEEIVVWKFRSMRADAADARAERQVSADDDRVTAIGRYLRRSSLDELPQLLNVLRGTMSLVGPRPHAIGMRTGEVESAGLVSAYAHRHRVKPGITGWAAVNGSRGPLHTPEDVARRVALDLDYIARQSAGLDLKIMLMTVSRLFGDRGVLR